MPTRSCTEERKAEAVKQTARRGGLLWNHSITLLLTLLTILLLSSCTLTHQEVRKDEIRNKSSNTYISENAELCEFKYSLYLASGTITFTYGYKDDGEEVEYAYRNDYERSTRLIMEERGCLPVASQWEDAKIRIQVRRRTHVSALPADYLTGLTFVLVPSWGTRKGQVQYIFDDAETGKKSRYYIDHKFFNHILLFPVSWMNLFSLDELSAYKKCLRDFLELEAL